METVLKLLKTSSTPCSYEWNTNSKYSALNMFFVYSVWVCVCIFPHWCVFASFRVGVFVFYVWVCVSSNLLCRVVVSEAKEPIAAGERAYLLRYNRAEALPTVESADFGRPLWKC